MKETINIGNKERQGLPFTSWIKVYGGLQIQPPFTNDRYEKMPKGGRVASRKKGRRKIKVDHIVIYLYLNII